VVLVFLGLSFQERDSLNFQEGSRQDETVPSTTEPARPGNPKAGGRLQCRGPRRARLIDGKAAAVIAAVQLFAGAAARN
jgi:hypothetical protein